MQVRITQYGEQYVTMDPKLQVLLVQLSDSGSALHSKSSLQNLRMPITPKFEWDETEGSLEVRVQLQGAANGKANVFATDCLLKINSPPYLLVLDLFGVVDDAKSSATLTSDGVTFKLVKVLLS